MKSFFVPYIFLFLNFYAIEASESGFVVINPYQMPLNYVKERLSHLKEEFGPVGKIEFERDYREIKSTEKIFLSLLQPKKIGEKLRSVQYRNEVVLFRDVGYRFPDLIKILLADPMFFKRDISGISVLFSNQYLFPSFLLEIIKNQSARVQVGKDSLLINNLDPYTERYYHEKGYECRINLHIHLCKDELRYITFVGTSLEDNCYKFGIPEKGMLTNTLAGERDSIEIRPCLQSDLYLILPFDLFTELKNQVNSCLRNILPELRSEVDFPPIFNGETQGKICRVVAAMGKNEREKLLDEIFTQLRIRKKRTNGVRYRFYPDRQDQLIRIAEEIIGCMPGGRADLNGFLRSLVMIG